MDRSVMIVAPHPDDAELGMGGTILAFRAGGINVVIVDLTDGEPTPFGSPEKRMRERDKATEVLGCRRELLGLKNREIFDSVENRNKLAELIRRHKPEILFVPYWEDAHPDHVQACVLAEASRFYAKFVKTDIPGTPHYPRRVFHYFAHHLRSRFQPSFIFDISAHIEKKLEAVAAYRSQFSDNPANLWVIDFIRRENAHWGAEIRADYGEPFSCRETVRFQQIEGLLNA